MTSNERTEANQMDAIKQLTKDLGKSRRSQNARQTELEEMRTTSLDLLQLTPEQAAAELDRRCPFCDALMIPTRHPHPLKQRDTYVFGDVCGCDGEAAADATAEAERIIQERTEQASFQRLRLEKAGLVGKLATASFDNFHPRKDWPGAEGAKERVQAYLQAFLDNRLYNTKDEPTPFLILYGQWGAGKSHLAAAVLHKAMEANRRAYFRVWPDYLQRLQNSWGNRDNPEAEQEQDIIKELQKGDIVCIDDLDKRKPTDWVKGVLFPALNHRYTHNLATIVTLNFSPEDKDPLAAGRSLWELYLGTATLDRLMGDAFDMIHFDGPSHRSGVKW
jgi:DNA replication protein DnaC